MTEKQIKKIVVAPEHIAAVYEFKEFNNFSVGKISYEAEGVDNRRGYISPRLTEEGWTNLENVIERNGHTEEVEFHGSVPNDWRHPDLM